MHCRSGTLPARTSNGIRALASNTTIIEEDHRRRPRRVRAARRRQAGRRLFRFQPARSCGQFHRGAGADRNRALATSWMGIENGSVFRAVATNIILFAAQIAMTAIVLRQLKRTDGFIPYLVADNWANVWVARLRRRASSASAR